MLDAGLTSVSFAKEGYWLLCDLLKIHYVFNESSIFLLTVSKDCRPIAPCGKYLAQGEKRK